MCIRDRIHDFLGKHMPEQSAADLKVKEFMRTGVYTVEQTRGINECIKMCIRDRLGPCSPSRFTQPKFFPKFLHFSLDFSSKAVIIPIVASPTAKFQSKS